RQRRQRARRRPRRGRRRTRDDGRRRAHLHARAGRRRAAAGRIQSGTRARRPARALRGGSLPKRHRHPARHQQVRRARPRAFVIRLEGVEKTYRTRRGDPVRAVEDITLEVGENEFVTLVGPSGCGKSTLLKLVAGLVPVTAGTIRVRNEVVREPFPDVGFVFQQAVLLPWRTVLDNVLFSVEMLGLEPRPYRKQAGDLLGPAWLGG